MNGDAGRHNRTIYLEATLTARSDLNTGIQRVVRNIARHSESVTGRLGLDVGVVLYDSVSLRRFGLETLFDSAQADPARKVTVHSVALTIYRRILWFICLLLPSKAARHFIKAPSGRIGLTWLLLFPFRKIRHWLNRLPAEGATLVLLDASWEHHPTIWVEVRDFKERGGRVIGIVYDVIAMTHPELCADKLTGAFREWLFALLDTADGIVCISAFSASCVQDIIDERTQTGMLKHPPTVSHLHLGAELDLMRTEETATPVVQEIFTQDSHVFLVVGSIEPRKNHTFILDAFERFWDAGGRGTLLIVGAHGWKNEAFLDRVKHHPKNNGELFLLRSANDADLNFAYQNASALVIASQVEGFGLPIVESFQYGLPVLCSDIPVFREIADGKATFFDLSDPAHLERALSEHCHTHCAADRARRVPRPYLSWEQSTQQFYDEITKINEPADRPKTFA